MEMENQMTFSDKKLENYKIAIEQLEIDREAFWECLEEYNHQSEVFFILEVLDGTDHFGEQIWTEKFRHHSKEWVGSFAALYCVSQTIRVSKVKRYLPLAESGTIIKEKIIDDVADGYDGIHRALGLGV
jgi:hypothetical protein